jgi:2-polyprenyl-6-methoxyphenol hydroxylase-like FAD-dependent oxidoreductase
MGGLVATERASEKSANVPQNRHYEIMNGSSIHDPGVLIVGAGPTGLVLALWLTRLGIAVRIVDKAASSGTTSRAVAVQARTLELYRQAGLADTVVEQGRRVTAANLWVAGRKAARLVFGDMGAGVSPFPYPLIFPQDEHERFLIDRLASLGVQVERQTELLDFTERGGHVLARLKRADGASERYDAAYIAGCDGAHSTVRQTLGIGFEGGTYSHLFYVADVQASGEAMNDEIHVALDATDFLAVFPLKGVGRARLVGTARDEAALDQQDRLSWNDVGQRVIRWMRIDVERVNWFSTYRVHHRVAGQFAKGRAFLLGDAAHVHSPVGGQGMNTGIGDAVNLAWKLAAVLHGRANPTLLDSYEPERIAFARRLVATTDRAFTGVTSSGAIARAVRLDVAPLLLPLLFRYATLRRLMFRTVSQTSIHYRESSLSQGAAGKVHGGDRLPWVKLHVDGLEDNFTPLNSLDWQVHAYGEASSELVAACAGHKLPLHVFPWSGNMAEAGLGRNAAYLVRPDGYVALADPAGSAVTITSYLNSHELLLRS